MHDLVLELECSDPLYLQLFCALRDRILAGELRPGTRLPPTRSLASRLGVSRSVVVAAYERLTEQGYAYAHVGAGTFVRLPHDERRLEFGAMEASSDKNSTRSTRAPGDSERRLARLSERTNSDNSPETRNAIDFGLRAPARRKAPMPFLTPLPGFPVSKHAPDDAAKFGLPALRQALSGLLSRSRGIHCQALQVVVVRDSLSALEFLSSLLVVSHSAPVIIEDPNHPSVQRVFASRGAALVPCPVTDDGLDIASAPVGGPSPLLVQVTPNDQFPSGSTMSMDRRRALLTWARNADALVIENSLEATMQQETSSPPWLASLDGGDQVIHVGTLADVPTPDLRLGFIVLPNHLVDPAEAMIQKYPQPVLDRTQSAVARLIRNGFYERLSRRAERRHARLRTVLAREIRKTFGSEAGLAGGLLSPRITLSLPDSNREQEAELVRRARELNVGVTSLSSFYLAAPPRYGVILGYGALSEDEVREGVRRLHRAWMAAMASAPAMPS